jgi:predicted outer membrane repeat protein
VLFGTKRKTRQQVKLSVESLEGRVVPTTFHVADVAHLVAAIAAVNNSTTPNTIVMTSGRYDLPGELQIQNAGDLTIRTTATKNAVSLVGEVQNRVMDIEGGKVTLSGLSISGGGNVKQGGGIYSNNANLTLQSTTIAGNSASEAGGGVYAQGGTLTLQSSTVSGNHASSDSIAVGGGIAATNAAVTITGSTISDNQADAVDQQSQHAVQAGGGGIFVVGGSLNVQGATISDNDVLAITNGTVATGSGGGIHSIFSSVTVARSTFLSNSVSAFSNVVTTALGGATTTVGGKLTITGSKFTQDTPGRRGEFGQQDATVLLNNSTVDKKRFSGTYILGPNGFTRKR